MSVYKLASVITAHAWSPDKTRVAVCTNEPDVIIYSNCTASDVSQWKKEHVLRRHTMVVVGIDWSASSNKIVTCSHDVNAFVWTFDQAKNRWDPKLSILRINRAALSCRWSPDGSKFCVASGSKVVPVCYYEQNQDWWVSKMLKKHRSTVIDVAWHPSSQIVATACADFKCRVFSAFIPASDKSAANTVLGNLESMQFGQCIVELEAAGGWIESVAWNKSGDGLAFVGHDSTLSFCKFASGQPPVCMTIKTQALPYTKVLFLGDDVLVAAGHNFEPDMYASGGAGWELKGSADAGEGAGAGAAKAAGGAFAGAQKMWNKRVKQGNVEGSGTDNLTTVHHNVITDMVTVGDGFSTSGMDGRIVVWSKATINKNVQGLSF